MEVLPETLEAHDGARIRVARLDPPTAPVGVIQIVHGFGEGIGHYDDVADFFARNGHACVMHDQRGFGAMPGKTRRQQRAARGVIPHYDCFLEDIKTVRAALDIWYPGLPVTLFGVSMGGNIVINHLLRHPRQRYEKAIAESPWLRLYKPLPAWVNRAARFAGDLSPRLAVSTHLDKNAIARDRDAIDRLKSDGIFHDRMSLRLYAQVTDAGEYALRHASRITQPLLLLCAGEDKIVSPQAIREFAGLARQNVVLAEYPGGYHCLHLDTQRAEVLNAMLAFIQRR